MTTNALNNFKSIFNLFSKAAYNFSVSKTPLVQPAFHKHVSIKVAERNMFIDIYPVLLANKLTNLSCGKHWKLQGEFYSKIFQACQ